jgi:hypothetical protein
MITFSTTQNESVTANVDKISLIYNSYSNSYCVLIEGHSYGYAITKGQYDILLMYLNPSDFRI